MGGLVGINGQQMGTPKTQAIPIDAIMGQFLSGITNGMMLSMFTKIFNKEEAEQVLIELYQNELTNWEGFFQTISASDIGSSGRVKKELEVMFENFKEHILKDYKE